MEGQLSISGAQLLLILGGSGGVIAFLFGIVMKQQATILKVANDYAEKLAERDRENNKILTENAIANASSAAALNAIAEKVKPNV